ncbi:MAG: hypothetical protein IJ379_03060, partial [Lachnospiraceae bacterium]|nr:hypothetical protein [Lachnospiraceae bacterium]
MKKFIKPNILLRTMVILLLSISLTGCGYTKEELQEMKEHEKQGETNALNYIKEKYGFDAAVTEVRCEKVASGFLDFAPASTGYVFVTMEYDEKTFLVSISGEQETTEGLDNYQFEEIKAALTQKLYDITNLPIEELYISYGKYQTMKNNMHGMINTYFDGNNLAEIMVDESRAVAVSYINQDVSTIDMDKVAEETGIEYYLFVDYDSKEHYETIKQPYYNIAGSPIDSDIDD